MKKKYSNLPLRSGVGIVVLNTENKVFVAKRIDNPKDFWQRLTKNYDMTYGKTQKGYE